MKPPAKLKASSRSQRTEIDGREWRSTATCAPRSVERVALDARSHDQKAGTVRHCRRKRRKMPEHLRIGPMEILDDDQRWSTAASMRATSAAASSRLPRLRAALSMAS